MMEWNELDVVTFFFVVGFTFALKRIDTLAKELTLLKSNVHNINIQVPEWEAGRDSTLSQRIESLEYQVFGASGNKIDYEDERGLRNRLDVVEERVRAGAGYLQLRFTNDENDSELDNVTYCIRSAAHHMLKKPE
tara:strand:+ start:94 stop:498 length:405 start_codon:yes stop_codon:yes gene_type:complete